jgi:phosphoglycerate dehydrogenase-like enzyme
LLVALAAGRLRSVALDVYVSEFEHTSPIAGSGTTSACRSTPYVSGATDVRQHRGIDLFCENLPRVARGTAAGERRGLGGGQLTVAQSLPRRDTILIIADSRRSIPRR